MKITVHSEYRLLSDFVCEVPDMMRQKQGELLYEGRNVVRLFDYEGTKLVVKQFKKAHIFQRIVYTFFRKTKAERAFLYAKELRQRGFETPHEVAYLEHSPWGLFRTGYFISTYCDYPTAYHDLAKVEDYNKELAASIAGCLAKLHQKGVLFGDLNLNNFLFKLDGDDYRLVLIDTNRSTFVDGMPSFEQCMLNLRTLTHRRDLLEYILRIYSRQMGWEEQAVTDKVFEALDAFEESRKRKKRFKKFLGLSR